MDPRLLLGVGARAGRREVRAAHSRIRALVAVDAGGTAELERLVDTALDVLTTGRGIDRLTLDPHAVLGVAADAGREQVRVAYRRLVPLVHPDRGGTDELFRIVAAAADILTTAGPSRRAATASDPWTRSRQRAQPTWSPPPPPPPRGPYRAPAPADRHVVPLWRAWRDFAQYAGLLLAVVLLAVAALQAGRVLFVLVVALAIGAFGGFIRPAIDGALRAAVLIAGSRVRVQEAVEPERFLADTCLDAPVGRTREDDLYGAYVEWCRRRGEPVAPWVFVERLRSFGLLFVKASAWEAGLWVGITLRR